MYMIESRKNYLSRLNFKKKKPSRFAGGWEMDEKEAEELKKELKDAWKKWEL